MLSLFLQFLFAKSVKNDCYLTFRIGTDSQTLFSDLSLPFFLGKQEFDLFNENFQINLQNASSLWIDVVAFYQNSQKITQLFSFIISENEVNSAKNGPLISSKTIC